MPSAPYVVPAVLLAATLLVSAVAKLRDPRDTSSVFRQLGLPTLLLRLRAPRLLPYGELVLVAALLLTRGGWYLLTASATLLLFAAYFAVILRALRLPYPVTCPCFGRLGLGQVTPRTLVRNGVLLALALVTWADAWRGEGVGSRLGHPAGRAWALGALLVSVIGVLVVVRRRRRPGTPLDAGDLLEYRPQPLPDGVLHAPAGPVSLWELADLAPRLLVFTDPETDPEPLSHARVWALRVPPVVVHVVTEHGGDPPDDDVLRDPGGVVRQALGVGSPGAVLLGTDRMLAGGPAEGLAQMQELVESVVAELGAADRQRR